MTHLLVVANETVDAKALRDALAARGDDLRVTVVSPVNEPQRGYVVYSDTRRASASRRLERALDHLREAGIPADGYVVEADPAAAVRDALAQLEPPVDRILVSTHPEEKSGWLRRNVLDRIRAAAGPVPVEHLVASASRTVSTGLVSTTIPCAEIPASRNASSVRSRRRPAAARRVSS